MEGKKKKKNTLYEKKRLTITLHPEIFNRISEISDAENLTVTLTCELILREGLKHGNFKQITE